LGGLAVGGVAAWVIAHGDSPVRTALMYDDAKTLTRLLDQQGLSPNASLGPTYRGDDTLLGFAVMTHAIQCIKLLIAHHVDVNRRDSSGFTPLMLAVASGSTLVPQMLLQAGADPGITNRGQTAADVAAKLGNTRAEEVIVDYVKSTDPKTIRAWKRIPHVFGWWSNVSAGVTTARRRYPSQNG
jgi:ankyrin repeat protein